MGSATNFVLTKMVVIIALANQGITFLTMASLAWTMMSVWTELTNALKNVSTLMVPTTALVKKALNLIR